MLSIKERVDNGVEVLDFYLPEWRTFIDAKRLDLSLPLKCILGQLELWKLFKTSEDCTDCGFLHTKCGPSSRAEYRQLTTEWLTRL